MKKSLSIELLFLFIIFNLSFYVLASNTDTLYNEMNNSKNISAFIPGQVIIKFKSDIDIPEKSSGEVIKTNKPSVNKFLDKYQVKKAQKIFKIAKNKKNLKSSQPLDNIVVVEVNSTLDAIQDIVKDPNVEYAEPNYLYHLNFIPDDPLYSSQWAHNITRAESGWDIEKGNSNITIAIIDTGIDLHHEDLTQNLWVNTDEIPGNGIDDDNNGYIDDVLGWDFTNTTNPSYCNRDCLGEDNEPQDEYGHGTHVGGIVAGVGNNGKGITGVCLNCKIMALRTAGLDEVSILSAIDYAVNNGAKVISMSFGSYFFSQTMKTAIDYAYSSGVVLVAAAGNGGTSSFILYPAGYDHVISVTATDSLDSKASFSNYGYWTDLAAPGVSIVSTLNDTSMIALRGLGSKLSNGYWILSGTSMATPYVSGIAGLILSKNDSLSPQEIELSLKYSVDPTSGSYYSGWGRVNVNKSLMIDSLDIGNLSLRSNPSGADVFVNHSGAGKFVYLGKTPLVSDLIAGERDIKVTKIGYNDNYTQVDIFKGLTVNLNITLNVQQFITVDTCMVLNKSKRYLQTQDIVQNNSKVCINVSAPDIVYDCNGFSITSIKNYSGVYSNKPNTTIRNCIISAGMGVGGYGIELVKGADNSSLFNNNLGDQNRGISITSASNNVIESNIVDVSCVNCYGMYLYGSSNNNLNNNLVASMKSYGMYFYNSPYNNLNNNIGGSNSSTGIYFYNASNNNLDSNTGISNSGTGLYIYNSRNNNLISNTGASNSSSGIYLYNAPYNNLDSNSGTSVKMYGIYANNLSNSNLISNTGASNSSYGIYIYGSSNNLTSNLGNSNSGVGLYLYNSKNNELTSNTGESNSSIGIYLYLSSNNNLNNNIGKGIKSHGMYFYNSPYNTLNNNVGGSNSSTGIYFYNASYNNLDSNTGVSNSGVGFYIYNSNFNQVSYNTGASNTSSGLYLYNALNNNFDNNIWTSNKGAGVYLYKSSNNTFTSDIGTSNTNYGIYLTTSSFNNQLTNIRAEGYLTGSYGMYISSSNNTFVNDCINISGVKSDVLASAYSKNVVFVNCSYTKEKVDTDSELIRKWYYQSYVNDTYGLAVINANVAISNIFGFQEFNMLTDITGYTPRIDITEYKRNTTAKVYYSPYTINVIAPGYQADYHLYNVTANLNNLNDRFILVPEIIDTPPVLSLLFPEDNQHYAKDTTVTFGCNATDDNNLANMTLYLYNSTDYLEYSSTQALIGPSDSAIFTYNPTYDDLYAWNCLVYDDISQSDQSTDRILNITT